MTGRDQIKIGINIGTMRGQKMFGTPIEHPAHALHRANEIIHENFDPRFSLFFIDESARRRKSRRRL